MSFHAFIFVLGALTGTEPCDCKPLFANVVRDYRGGVDVKSIEFLMRVQSAIKKGSVRELMSLSGKHAGNDVQTQYESLMKDGKDDEFFFYGCLDASGRA